MKKDLYRSVKEISPWISTSLPDAYAIRPQPKPSTHLKKKKKEREKSDFY